MDYPGKTIADFITAIENDNIETTRNLLASIPESTGLVNRATFKGGLPSLAAARSRDMVDLLLSAGASVAEVTKCLAPGIGVGKVVPQIAGYLLTKGVELSPHAAAALGFTEQLREMLDQDPKLVHAKGGDSCRPLHFARDVPTAQLLLERGAEIDSRDEDHGSTAVQWRIKEAPEVSQYLLENGAAPDIFAAAALGDSDLAKRIIADDPDSTRFYIGNNHGPFPGIGHEDRGGTIYQWTLGFNRFPHEIARDRGHDDIFDLLMEHTAPEPKWLVACALGNRKLAEEILNENPEMISQYDSEDLALLAKLCWETNLNTEAVEIMLDLGFPVDIPEKNHGYTALHNAAWCGRPDLVKRLLDHGHPVDLRHPEYKATALGFAIHSCIEARRHPDGKFGEVARLLLDAGTPFDTKHYPVGDAAIDEVLKQHFKL